MPRFTRLPHRDSGGGSKATLWVTRPTTRTPKPSAVRPSHSGLPVSTAMTIPPIITRNSRIATYSGFRPNIWVATTLFGQVRKLCRALGGARVSALATRIVGPGVTQRDVFGLRAGEVVAVRSVSSATVAAGTSFALALAGVVLVAGHAAAAGCVTTD